jgi:hypothetical protein
MIATTTMHRCVDMRFRTAQAEAVFEALSRSDPPMYDRRPLERAQRADIVTES